MLSFQTHALYYLPHEEYIAEMRKCLKSEGLLASDDSTYNDEGGNKAID